MGLLIALLAARLRSGGSRRRALVAALAAGATVPLLVAGSAAVTADASLGRAVGDLPVGERTVIVSYNGDLEPAEAAAADADVRRRLAELGSTPIRRQLEFRQLADGAGGTFTLGAADGLATAVRLTDGRLPRSCTPTRCEVLVVPGRGSTAARDPAIQPELGLVVVGHARRSDPLLLSGTFEPSPDGPLVLADGVDAAADLAGLALFQRSYGWVAALDPDALQHRGVPAWIETAARTADRLWADREGLVLTSPDEVLRAEDDRARRSSSRFTLLGSTAAVLLLGAAVVGGAALRPDAARFVDALRRRGAAPRWLTLLGLGEATAIAVAGAVCGVVAGTLLVAVLAGVTGLPVTRTVVGALGDAGLSVLGLTVVAAILMAVSMREWRVRPPEVWRAVTTLAAGCIGVAALLAARGGADARDPLLLALPALVLIAAGLVAARLWPPMTRAAQRLVPRRAVAARLGLAAAAARPLTAAATAGLLAAAVGATGFAAGYRATLSRGAADQAAFAVPTDVRVLAGRGLARPLDVAPISGFAVVPSASGHGVLRDAGSLRVGSTRAETVQFVGVDPDLLPRLSRWDAVTGSSEPPDDVAAALAVPSVPRGVVLPPGRQLRLTTPGTAVGVAITAVVRSADGRERGIPLAVSRAGGEAGPTLTATLPVDLPTANEADPTGDPQWSLIALSLAEPADDATRRQHALGEGDNDIAAREGIVRWGTVSVDGAAVAHPWRGWQGEGFAADPTGGAATLRYRLAGNALVIDARPGGQGVTAPLPVAADQRSAAAGPNLTLTLGGRSVLARVVAVLPRFPTVAGRFVVADREALARLITHADPGTAQADEVWVDLPGAADDTESRSASGHAAARAALGQAPFDRLTVRWGTDAEDALRDDPVAVGASSLLAGGAVLTLVVALAALVLLIGSERRDGADELYAWEADGIGPPTLRAALWWRAALVTLVAIPVGAVAGLALTRLTARLIALTAGAGLPQPPLVPVAGVGLAVLSVAATLLVALAIAGLVAARQLREPMPLPARSLS